MSWALIILGAVFAGGAAGPMWAMPSERTWAVPFFVFGLVALVLGFALLGR